MSKAFEDYMRAKMMIKEHERYFSECLPLIASENVTSRDVRLAVASDMMHRYAEGEPGERIYAGCRYMDEVERLALQYAKKLFHAEFADARPISGLTANLAVYTALTKPGERIASLPTYSGGHISSAGKKEHGSAWMVHGLNVEDLAFDESTLNIDVDVTLKRLTRLNSEGKKVRIVTFGASLFLFPHPVKELEDELHSLGSVVMYDAAHVAGLIAGKKFQNPMKEGADLVTFSTHKTMYGPQGGMIIGRARYKDRISKGIFPGVTSNHHPNLVAGKALALMEMAEFGEEYAKQVISNAKVLAERLSELGLKVLGEKLGFTESHQVALNLSEYGGGIKAEKQLESYNILCNRQSIPKSRAAKGSPEGIRLGTAELTRFGMKNSEMKEIAELIYSALKGKEKARVLERVKELRKDARSVKFTFFSTDAYIYAA